MIEVKLSGVSGNGKPKRCIDIYVSRESQPKPILVTTMKSKIYRSELIGDEHLVEKTANDVLLPFINMSPTKQLLTINEYSNKINPTRWDWYNRCCYYDENNPNKINVMGNVYHLGRKDDIKFIYNHSWMGFKKESPFPFFDNVKDIFKFIMSEQRIQ
jgi:hypothetical protein